MKHSATRGGGQEGRSGREAQKYAPRQAADARRKEKGQSRRREQGNHCPEQEPGGKEANH